MLRVAASDEIGMAMAYPMRLGLGTGYGDAPLTAMAEWIAEADRAGFELGFFSETIDLRRDAVTALTTFAGATKRMLLGSTMIARLRSPVLMAQTIASLDEITDGRLVVAPGACTPTHAARHSLPPASPVGSLREWIESIRAILSGELISYQGRHVQLENIQLGWVPLRARVPMYVAATSRIGLELAGAVADGVVLNAACSPDYSKNAIRILRESVARADRSWKEFEVAQIVNCSIGRNTEEAREAVRWEVASKFSPTQFPFNFRARIEVGEPAMRIGDEGLFKEAWRSGSKEMLVKAIPIRYIDALTASGTRDEVIEKIHEYHRAGVNLIILRPATSDAYSETIHLLGDLLERS